MVPAYKLTYFNSTALGEPIRMLFSYGGIEFEDIRINQEDWLPSLKSKMPFGQMPILEYEGKVINQSRAITRYVAKQVKLVGKDDWENAEIDAAVDNVDDLREKLSVYYYEPKEEIKALKRQQLTEFLPFYLERLNEQAKINNGYLACGRLTWADFFFAGLLYYLNVMSNTDLIANYANLQVVKRHVEEIPSVKAWLAKRPKTAR